MIIASKDDLESHTQKTMHQHELQQCKMLDQSSQSHSSNIPSDKENGNNQVESSNGNTHNVATCVMKNRDINDKGYLNFSAHYYDQCF